MLTAQELEQAKNTKLSKNFTLYEMIRSDSYPNHVVYPSQEVINLLTDFCNDVLQPIRDKFGAIRINSGYRNPRLNKAVGGVSDSVHQILNPDHSEIVIGVAADIVPLKADINEVYKYIRDNMENVKTIIMYRRPSVTRTPFIHVDTRIMRKGRAFLEKIAAGRYIDYK